MHRASPSRTLSRSLPRSLFRTLSRSLPRPLSLSLPRILLAPAFWSAHGGPASHHRRGRAGVNGEGCDHADGAPAASIVTGIADVMALPVECPVA